MIINQEENTLIFSKIKKEEAKDDDDLEKIDEILKGTFKIGMSKREKRKKT